MEGKFINRHTYQLTWSYDDKLYSPDGLKHLLLCEVCSSPIWVDPPAVSVFCNDCWAATEQGELSEPPAA